MLEREPPAAQPAGVDRTRCHRAGPAGPPRQQSQGSPITGHVPGDDLPQDPRVRDHHPGQLTCGYISTAAKHDAGTYPRPGLMTTRAGNLAAVQASVPAGPGKEPTWRTRKIQTPR